MALTPQQELFCREYVKRNFNATDAYRAAYPKSKPTSAEASGSRLLGNVKVQNRVAELSNKAAADEAVTPQMVIRELKFIAFQRQSQLYRSDGTMKAPHEWDEATDATISGLETEEEVEVVAATDEQEPQAHGGSLKRKRGAHVATRTLKVKRWGKEKALELLMRHMGMLKEDAPHPDRAILDLKGLTDDVLDRALTAVAPLLAPDLRALAAPGEVPPVAPR